MKRNLRKNIKLFCYCFLFALFILPPLVVLIRQLYELELQLNFFSEVLSFYQELSTLSFHLIQIVLLFSVVFFILFKLFHFFHSTLSRRIGSKKTLILYSSILSMFVIDFVLEYPYLLNKEILFTKSVETKYCFSSRNESNPLPNSEISNIYRTILSKDSCLVLNRLSNGTGLYDCSINYHLSIEQDIQGEIQIYWKEQGLNNRFVSDYEKVLQDGGVINDFTFVTLGPIKLIDGNFLIGYSEYRGTLDAFGYLIKLEKQNGKWTLKQFTIGWIS